MASDGSDLRNLFLLRPDVIYFNHGSSGACPRPVFEAYQSWQLELERQPVDFGRRLGALMREARQALGSYVGADADDVVYVTNATMGINIVARSLPLAPGDEVLSTDHEYGSMERTWQFVCAKCGARYVRQPVPVPVESAEQVIEAIWSGVTRRTRVLFISHITSPTALIFPLPELVCRAHEAGIITVVDGAHAPGQVPLDLASLGVDFYTGNCHKWMMAPKGSAFLYARREMQSLLEPLVVSWGWGNEKPWVSRFVDEQQNQGTRDMSAYLAVPAAICFMEEHDWPTVRRACHELVRYARYAIADLTGLAPICPDELAWFAQMASLPLPPCDVQALYRKLHEEYAIEMPIFAWSGRLFMRLSVQGYNTRADIETLVEALAASLPSVGA
jgi:isopenicillin-N epimerase